ncbi:hypothetical protein PHYPO_G00118530 [Pangasianodon hypophthalmus]|uniref:Uncharacterized protein n=1 Tax=Pangasianodon hypophthalmus TaxID=310915 RepID=A0A5N5KYJ0_PANHP|nr:hypothetical protein PHYPO_G00118530 [Pangasianodon hypophthalmus]
MAVELSKARLRLINGVNEALLKDLIDGLRDANPPVLTGREANEILQAHRVTEDKTGLLVDMDQPASQQTPPRMEFNESNLR